MQSACALVLGGLHLILVAVGGEARLDRPADLEPRLAEDFLQIERDRLCERGVLPCLVQVRQAEEPLAVIEGRVVASERHQLHIRR